MLASPVSVLGNSSGHYSHFGTFASQVIELEISRNFMT